MDFAHSERRQLPLVTATGARAVLGRSKIRFYDWPVGLEVRGPQNLRALLRPGTGALRPEMVAV